MEKSLHLREQNLLKERATNKKLSADLEAKTQESFEHAQEAHYLSRQLKYSQEDCKYLRVEPSDFSRAFPAYLIVSTLYM